MEKKMSLQTNDDVILEEKDLKNLCDNRLFLITFYCFLEMSPAELSPIGGLHERNIVEKVKKLLPYCHRDRKEALILSHKKKAMREYSFPIGRIFREQLIGSLFADGYLEHSVRRDKNGNFTRYSNTAFFCVSQKSIHCDYLNSLVDKVANTGLKSFVDYNYYKRLRKDGSFTYHSRFKTLHSIELREWFWDWHRFPTDEERQRSTRVKHIKILPKWLTNSDFTPYVLYVWHIEDGSYHNYRHELCTHNFSESENERLASFLKETLDFPSWSDHIKVVKTKTRKNKIKVYNDPHWYYNIALSQKASKRYFAYIEPYRRVFPSYNHKFP